MVDDIKLDKLSVPLTTQRLETNAKKQPANIVKQDDVTVTNNLNKFISSVISEDNSPSEQARVSAMKERVQSGNYRIDTDALAGKLLTQVFSKRIGN